MSEERTGRMKILIDTHIALRSLYDSGKLAKKSREYLSNPENEIYYSIISVWEVGLKHSIGKLEVPAEDFTEDCENAGFQILNLKKEHLFEVEKLPFPEGGHKDPFDRLLLSQAKTERYGFLTEDENLLEYKEKCIL